VFKIVFKIRKALVDRKHVCSDFEI
jgi:hypothetical protein